AAACPEVDVEVLEMLSLTPRVFRACYVGGFIVGMTRVPWVYGACFKLTNRPQRPGRNVWERVRLSMERVVLGRFAEHLLRRDVDVVVCTHFLPAGVVGRLILSGRLGTRHMVVVTDIDVHRWWYSEGVDHWFVPTPDGGGQLQRWGIDPGKITASGIPVHPKWTSSVDPAKVLADWRLPPDMPVVLLSGGAQFTCGPVVKIAGKILATCKNVCVVVLAGRNKKLLASLTALPESGSRLFGMGYTDRVHELVSICSLVVTKPGGVITAECLSKGAPMVLISPVPGQESGNAEYLLREGAAVISRTVDEIASEVARLMGDPHARADLAANARRLYRPATQTIVARIRAVVGA
ncbi:MAG: hypothetical protein KAX78_11505, partial [Phycisphaerae bacterium]|nr:hypothetical protein [Phycisphaerae bacterium]